MSETVICKQIKCNDYLTDDGDPAWCFWAGCPAKAAMAKCPKVLAEHNREGNNGTVRK